MFESELVAYRVYFNQKQTVDPYGKLTDQERAAEIAKLEKEMKEASKMLEFEYAAVLRDRIIELRGEK